MANLKQVRDRTIRGQAKEFEGAKDFERAQRVTKSDRTKYDSKNQFWNSEIDFGEWPNGVLLC